MRLSVGNATSVRRYSLTPGIFRRFQAHRMRRPMKHLLLKLMVYRDTRGQDLIEYSLMAGFVATAAGAIMPGLSTSVSTIFSKVASVMHNSSVPT